MRAKQRLGQHFLEPAWADKVVSVIDPRAEDRFLEIGPGPGALTLRLAPRVRHVTAVEVDRGMVALLSPKVPPNVDLIETDFLDFDLESLTSGGVWRIAGNLPYNVSSPILFRLLDAYRQGTGLRDATVMVQLEVAERIEAGPGKRAYGLLAIFVQLQADVRRLLTLPPGAFRPAPRVRSAVIRLGFRPPLVGIANPALFEAMVRSMFTQRRKTLANALRPFAEAHGRTASDALVAAGLDSRRRPETLTLAELAALADAFGTARTTEPPASPARR
jgi:16S rRNA (adenine1518-N6/adenine1519-N6)-dimethyltransferase